MDPKTIELRIRLYRRIRTWSVSINIAANWIYCRLLAQSIRLKDNMNWKFWLMIQVGWKSFRKHKLKFSMFQDMPPFLVELFKKLHFFSPQRISWVGGYILNLIRAGYPLGSLATRESGIGFFVIFNLCAVCYICILYGSSVIINFHFFRIYHRSSIPDPHSPPIQSERH